MSKNPIGRQPGYTVSDSTKALISASRKGSIPVNRQGVIIEGTIYESIRAASKALNINTSTISYRCLSLNARFKEWNFL
jgi:hypothetical protein